MNILKNIIIPIAAVLTLLMVVLLVGPTIFAQSGRSVSSAGDDGSNQGVPESSKEMLYSTGADTQMAGESFAQKGEAFPQEDTEIPTQTMGEYIIREANLSIEVKDIESKVDEARKVIKDGNGQVTYASSRVKDRETISANYGEDGRYPYYPVEGDYAVFHVEVPVAELDALVESLRGVGKVISDSTSSSNVTLEVTGLDAEIASGVKSLERLEALLEDAKTVEEVLRVEDTLQQRRGQLESLKAQSEMLKNRAATSTVVVSLVTPKAAQVITGEVGWFQETWDKVSSGLSGSVALVIVSLSVLIPFGLLYWLIASTIRRNKKKDPVSTTPKSNVKKDDVKFDTTDDVTVESEATEETK